MPAVLYPLIDAAAHIVQAKRVWLEAADLGRLLDAGSVGAILAIGHTRLKLIAPPVLRLRASSRGIFPFSLARKSIRLSRCAREPGGELLGVTPAHIGDGCIIFAGCRECTSLRGGAFVPVANGNRILTDRKRLDRDLMSWPLREVVVATHCKAAAAKRLHLRLSDRWRWRCGGRPGWRSHCCLVVAWRRRGSRRRLRHRGLGDWRHRGSRRRLRCR